MVALRVDTRRLVTALRRVPKKLEAELARSLREHGAAFEQRMGRRQFGARLNAGRNPTRDRLASRTGALRRSIRTVVIRGGGVGGLRLRASVGNSRTAAYVHTQEEGATIRGNPWLAVPLPANLTAAGRQRFSSPRELMRDGEVKTFLRKSKAGNLIIFRQRQGGEIEPLWVLKRQVVIPPRLGFRRTLLGTKMRDHRIASINRGVRRALGDLLQRGGRAR